MWEVCLTGEIFTAELLFCLRGFACRHWGRLLSGGGGGGGEVLGREVEDLERRQILDIISLITIGDLHCKICQLLDQTENYFKIKLYICNGFSNKDSPHIVLKYL